MHACLQAGKWDEALDLWADLRNRPNAPNPCSATYAAALRACGGGGSDGGGQARWDTAKTLLAEMRAAGGRLAPTERHYALAACAAANADEAFVVSGSIHEYSGSARGGSRADGAFSSETTANSEISEIAGVKGSSPRGGRIEEGRDIDGGEGMATAEGGEASDGVIDSNTECSIGLTALSFLLFDMEAEGCCPPGWEFYAAVSWARTQQQQWYQASAGVLELMRERGVRDVIEIDRFGPVTTNTSSRGRSSSSSNRRPHLEGIRGLYARLMIAASRVEWGLTTGRGESDKLGDAGTTIWDILADADERLAPPSREEGEGKGRRGGGGVGLQLLAVAARAFARAGDWKGARDVALQLCDMGSSSAVLVDQDTDDVYNRVSASKQAVAAEVKSSARSTALCAAVSACARAGELVEAEALADRARVLAANQKKPSDYTSKNNLVSISLRSFSPGSAAKVAGTLATSAPTAFGEDRRAILGEGLDREACVTLAEAYEEAGRESNAEALRQRLQGEVAAGLGVHPAIRGKKAGVLPTIAGGHRRTRGTTANVPEEDERGAIGWQGHGGVGEYDLYLDWIGGGEENDMGGDDEGREVKERGRTARQRPRGTWGGLTERDLVGW